VAARLMTLQEAEEWSSDLNSQTRTKPVWEEYRFKPSWSETEVARIEKIEPTDDFLSADIIGYNQTMRLWTAKPTNEQIKSTPYEDGTVFDGTVQIIEET